MFAEEESEQSESFSHIHNWVLESSVHSNNFICEQNKLKMEGSGDIFGAHVFGNKFTFIVAIDKLEEEIGFGIGIIDASYYEISNFTNLSNWICYYRGGELEIGGDMNSEENMKFNEGDTVEVRGNRNLMMIEWLINNKVALSYCWDLMKKKEIDWVISVFSQRGNVEMRMIEKWDDIDVLGIFLAEEFYLWDEDIMYLINEMIVIMEWEREEMK